MRVLAAMSGGVDSAVAAARAVDAGHDVTGVHLALAQNPATLRHGARGCCTLEDANDARRAADVLGIPFYIWDLAERFRADVIEDFVDEYAAGRTPNPCLRCNEKIKFTAVLDRALALGFDAVVTGHHARLDDGVLRRSVDPAKDQSYVLAVLTPDQLRARDLPARRHDEEPRCAPRPHARGLAVADKPDSHDICFIADGDTRGFLQRRLGDAPGEIVDAETGAVLGTHSGSFGFTVGQRRGLHLDRRRPGRRAALRAVDPAQRPTASSSAAVSCSTSTRSSPTVRCGRARRPPSPFDCAVQLRAHGMVSAGPGGARRHRRRRPAGRAAARGRCRSGAGDVRRRPGARLGHDHRPRLARPPSV